MTAEPEMIDCPKCGLQYDHGNGTHAPWPPSAEPPRNAELPCPAREGETMTFVETEEDGGEFYDVFTCTCRYRQHVLEVRMP